MTKKHLVVFAKHLKATRPEFPSGLEDWQWNHDVQAIANACKEINNAFNAAIFVDACGGFIEGFTV